MAVPGDIPPGLRAATSRPAASFGMKVSLGCGVLLLLFLFTCGSFTWMAKRQANAAADRAWAQMKEPFDRIRNVEDAVAFYRGSSGLQARFSDEASFLRSAEAWRPRLDALPAHRPPLGQLLGEGGTRFRVREDRVKGQTRTWIRYTQPGGATFTVELERGQVMDLDVH